MHRLGAGGMERHAGSYRRKSLDQQFSLWRFALLRASCVVSSRASATVRMTEKWFDGSQYAQRMILGSSPGMMAGVVDQP
jgi:hypothetical protein